MYNPLISVIVPVYNSEKYLKKCLDSLIHQTYRNLEIICVDDESQDRSGQIMDEYAGMDPRIKAIHRAHGGVSASRNTAMAAATGEWIASLDSDDYLDPGIYEKAVAKLTDGVDILVYGTRLVYEDLPIDGLEHYFSLPPEGGLERGDARRARLDVCLWNKLWRRSFMDEYGLKFPEGYVHEDDYMYRCLAPHARSIYIFPQVGYNYVQHPRSITHSDKTELQKYRDRLHIIDMIVSFHVSTGLIDQVKEYILPFWAHCLYSCSSSSSPDFTARAMKLNQEVISKHHLDEIYKGDCYLRQLLPHSRWKELFVRWRTNSVTYRFFGIHLFTVVYEGYRPVRCFSAWVGLLKRLLGGKG